MVSMDVPESEWWHFVYQSKLQGQPRKEKANEGNCMSNRSINAVTRKAVKTSEKEERVDVCNQLLLYKSIAPAFFWWRPSKGGCTAAQFQSIFYNSFQQQSSLFSVISSRAVWSETVKLNNLDKLFKLKNILCWRKVDFYFYMLSVIFIRKKIWSCGEIKQKIAIGESLLILADLKMAF